jgi:glycosyltransferase involved in cell wall biosynthesis
MSPQAVPGLENVARPRTIVFVQPTSEVGGSDIALYRLVSHLDPAVYRPIVVLPREGPLVSKLRSAGCRVVILPMMQLRPVRSVGYRARYIARFWPSVFRLAALMRRERADLVHSNSLYALHGPWAALLARVPHVCHVREIPDAPKPLQKLLTTTAARLSARVIPMTDAVARLFRPNGASGSKVTVIPDGIDLTAFNARVSGARIRRELRIPADVPLVGFVGRLDPWKGADVFVRAAAEVAKRCPAARFLVCGGDLPGYEAYAEGVRRLALEAGLGGRIYFTGWTYRLDDIPEVMAALDVLVHTSTRPEPFGLVLVEAMATAKPVVASNDGGVPEVVEAGVTGHLVEPENWRAVAAAIEDLLANPSRAAAFGAAGRARVERLFEVRAYVDKVQALYASIIRPAAADRSLEGPAPARRESKAA